MTTERNNEEVTALIVDNSRVTVHDVANQLQINHGSTYQIFHHRFHFHKSCPQNNTGKPFGYLWLPSESVSQGKWHLSEWHCHWWQNLYAPKQARKQMLENGTQTPKAATSKTSWNLSHNWAYYNGMLDNKPKLVVWSKHQGQLSQCSLLFHGNACPCILPTLLVTIIWPSPCSTVSLFLRTFICEEVWRFSFYGGLKDLYFERDSLNHHG